MPNKCVACRHYLHKDTCVEQCPAGHYTYKGWRCVSTRFCQERYQRCKEANGTACQHHVIHHGACLPEFPSGYTTANATS